MDPSLSPLVKEDSDKFYGGNEIRADADDDNETDVVIQLDNIHKTYLLGLEGVPALRGVSLSIKKGEFVIIFGLSGGGKTTLLNVLGTIDKPTKGINSKTEDSVFSQLRLKKMFALFILRSILKIFLTLVTVLHPSGFVFQTFNLLSSLSTLENVEMPMILAGELSAADRRARAVELLNSVGMGARLSHLPSQLSGGEQQRVTIARSMANEPEILLLDEPTGDLDTLNTAIVMKLLTDLNRNKKITLVMVTHDVGLKNFADRVVWMRDGKIVRVEAVNSKKKAQRYSELDDEIATLSSGHKRMAKVNQPGFNTFIRQPEDYVTNPNHQHREPISFQFSSPSGLNMTQAEYEARTGLVRAVPATGSEQDLLPPPRGVNVRGTASNSLTPESLRDSGSLEPAKTGGDDSLLM